MFFVVVLGGLVIFSSTEFNVTLISEMRNIENSNLKFVCCSICRTTQKRNTFTTSRMAYNADRQTDKRTDKWAYKWYAPIFAEPSNIENYKNNRRKTLEEWNKEETIMKIVAFFWFSVSLQMQKSVDFFSLNFMWSLVRSEMCPPFSDGCAVSDKTIHYIYNAANVNDAAFADDDDSLAILSMLVVSVVFLVLLLLLLL